MSDRPIVHSRWTRPALLAWSAVCLFVLAATAADQWRVLTRACQPGECIPLQLQPASAETLQDAGWSLTGYATAVTAYSVLFGLATFGLGWLIAWRAGRRAARLVPPVLLAMGATVATTYQWGGGIGTLRQVLECVAVAGLFWLVATFPDLRFNPRWTVAPAGIAIGWTIVTVLVPPVAEAIAADRGFWAAAVGPVFAASLLGILAGQAVRFRRGSVHERRQMGLVLLAVGILAAVGVAGALSAIDPPHNGIGTVTGTAWHLASIAAVTLILATVATSLVRHSAYGFGPVVPSVVTAALVLGAITGVYALVVATLSLLADGWMPAAAAAIATALMLAPIRSRVSRTVDRLAYGDAADPLQVADALTRCLTEARSSSALIPAMADVLAHRLALPHVAVTLDTDRGIEAGTDLGRPLAWSLPLDPGTGQVGTVAIALRPGQRRVSARDRAALRAAANPLAAAAVAVRLAEELQRSRTAVVNTREEERKALRQQLHDEVGPTLASLRHRVNAARRDLGTDTGLAGRRLTEADALVAGLLADVRALARDLRPPELDELGLARAAERFASDLGLALDVDTDLDDLPAAVEIAAYRIVIEALLNAQRHGRATQVTLRAHNTAGLVRIDVTDNGTGPAPGYTAGVGMLSMRERAEELGGSVTLAAGHTGGGQLSCELPVPTKGRT